MSMRVIFLERLTILDSLFTHAVARTALVFALAAVPGCALVQLPPPASTMPAQEGRLLVLTPSVPRASSTSRLRAAGSGSFSCDLILIDTRAFRGAGTLSIQLTLGTGESAASFSLFPEQADVRPPADRPDHLAWERDVSPGWRGELQARLSGAGGQVYKLCAEGNWFSPVGATNTYSVVASVQR